MSIYDYGFDNNLNKKIADNSSGVVYDTVDNALNTGSMLQGGNLTLKTLSIGGLVRQVAPGDDIQAAIDAVNREGGGTVQLLAKTYTINDDINMRSNVSLVGQGIGVTIINFVGNFSIITDGSNEYNTGTITSVVGQTTVTGSGTAWLTNVTPFISNIFLNNRWHLIAAVGTNTSLTLAESYTGPTINAGTTYKIARPLQNATLNGFTVQNSQGLNLQADLCKVLILKSILLSGGAGSSNCNITNTSILTFDSIVSLDSTGHGFEIANCGIISFDNCPAISNTQDGFNLNNCKEISIDGCVIEGNSGDGMNITNCTSLGITNIGSSNNAGQGIEFVGGNSECFVFSSNIKNNTSDGVRLTATCNSMVINSNVIAGNGGYGVNIANANDVSNIVSANVFYSNNSGQIGNSGTGTVARGNINQVDI